MIKTPCLKGVFYFLTVSEIDNDRPKFRINQIGMNSLWYFDNVNLFKTLCPHKFKDYKKNHKLTSYAKEDYIYFEEDSSSKVYLIEKGKVKIGYYREDGKEVIKAILTKGELFGEKAILGENTRDEFAKSIDNQTSICPIKVDVMHNMMRDNKSFSLSIYKFIGLRLKKLERRLQLLLFKDTRTRLLEFLDELSKESGRICEKSGDTVIYNPYTQKDIASLIGTSRPNLNIVLNELKSENFLDFNRNQIRIYKK